MMLDLNALFIFAKVVEANSFAMAARQLRIPTSTVSRRVAELESQLGVRLLERSTRSLRLTDLGSEVLEQARRSIEISDGVMGLVSNRMTDVSGVLRIASLPSISDTLVAPLVGAFQAAYPNVLVQVLVTERYVDQVAEGIDVAFQFGPQQDSDLVARKILTYRHRLVASPAYLTGHPAPLSPQDLYDHRLLAFSFGKPDRRWTFTHQDSDRKETVTFQPSFTMNDYLGLASALLAGSGIGDLPPIVRPDLLDDGRLVEAMPGWRFRPFDLTLVHLGHRYVPRPVRLFKEMAVELASTLFPDLPS
ncbi:LysR family transcriptional regulator [Methylobacterium sp. J-072]|uniref:LysR family transcriptional regulator n=2 Tax=unclassified Methylobacterium TaxID=2615210 RepID=UPI001FB8DA23|nr:LysR family transcriptional regulator [Methylobacterium sp. J-072]MCJ2093990.1 LysR family transcriptional regulator [Methylobacterium sp. J-072]MCJ2138587.1 LysR family transcriptional regulator [Methylobacterium sp. E-066]